MLFYISLQQVHRCTNVVVTVVQTKGTEEGKINYELLYSQLKKKVIIAQNLKVYSEHLGVCFGTQVSLVA